MDSFARNFVAKYSRLLQKSQPHNLLKLLSAVEYAEAILEITADKLFGHRIKWLFIFLTHLTKCIIRLQLLVVHHVGLQSLPSLLDVSSFIGNKIDEKKKPQDKNVSVKTCQEEESTFTLKHSGRSIRSIKNAPNFEKRDWSVPSSPDARREHQQALDNNGTTTDNELTFDPNKDLLRYIAEILHISRPLCHLVTIFVFNSKSWTQLMVPLTMDTLSLFCMSGTLGMSEAQKKEMKRRALLFFYYLIRSPIYENYTSSIINVGLSQFEQHIPGMKFLIKPIKDYIPQWREIYNYCWA